MRPLVSGVVEGIGRGGQMLFPPATVWGVRADRDLALVDGNLVSYADAFDPARSVDLSAGYDTITSPAQPSAVQGTRPSDGVTAEPFPGWEDQGLDAAGWFWAVYRPTEANDNAIFDILDGTSNNRIRAYHNNVPDAVQYQVVSGGSTVVNKDTASPSPTLNTLNAIAGRFSADDFAVCLNGGAVVTDAAGAMPVGVTVLNVGWGGGLNTLTGGLAALAFGAGLKTDAELKALSRL